MDVKCSSFLKSNGLFAIDSRNRRLRFLTRNWFVNRTTARCPLKTDRIKNGRYKEPFYRVRLLKIPIKRSSHYQKTVTVVSSTEMFYTV